MGEIRLIGDPDSLARYQRALAVPEAWPPSYWPKPAPPRRADVLLWLDRVGTEADRRGQNELRDAMRHAAETILKYERES